MVLALIAVIMILAVSFMGIVRFQTQRTGFEQATITSAYVAEIGFQQVRAQLSAVGGDWTQLPGTDIEQDCSAGNPNRLRCQKSPVAAGFNNLHMVYENPLDTTSRVIGRYEYTIETGEKRALFGNKTVLGSTVGYIPGSLIEQVGYDNYGNKLCDASVTGGSCPGNFVGVKVKAWLTDAQGNEIPNARPQSVYGVLSMDSRDPDDQGPSGYMLESDEKMQISTNMAYDRTQAKLVAYGGFYGPVHTNQNFKFVWESDDTHDGNSHPGDYVIEKTNNNALDEIYPGEGVYTNRALWERPFWGILMADLGVQHLTAPRIRGESDGPGLENYIYIPYGRYFKVTWNAGMGPPPGAQYTAYFSRPHPQPAASSAPITRGTGAIDQGIPSPITAETSLLYRSEAWPLELIEYGGFDYIAGTHFTANSAHLMAWNAYGDTSREFGSGEMYRGRFISHSPIKIHEKMSYSGASPNYLYYHTHPVSVNWPYYQVAHKHDNIVGADLATNSVSDYDTTTWLHSHGISNDVSLNTITSGTGATAENTFLEFKSNAYRPALQPQHEVPLLKPEADITNYKNQLEQLNKYLELTLGSTLPRNSDGSINATPLASAPYNATDYEKGYIVGKFPSALPNTTIPLVDFRAVYFGKRETLYNAGASAGSRVIADTDPYTKTVAVWVGSDPNHSSYMKIASENVSSHYRLYLFRQIPAEKVLLVRDAAVLIGNLKPQGSATCGAVNTAAAHCLSFLPGYVSDPVGESTIINGQLSIISFTTTPSANEHEYSRGDIVVVGNVLYHNDFYADDADKTQMRQLMAQPVSPYTRSRTVNGPISSITDTSVGWVTKVDGARHRDNSGQLVGSLDGLGLFATHDIKISVTPMGNGYTKASWPTCNGGGTVDSAIDSMMIHGQLVAGNRVRVHAFLDGAPVVNLQTPDVVSAPCNNEPPYESYKDSLSFRGTVYSRYSPNFSEYFKVKREYFFDRSLQKNPLVGAPYYPKTAGDYKNQTVFNNFPSLVPGTWVQATQ